MYRIIVSVLVLLFLLTGCIRQENYVKSDSKRLEYKSIKDTIRNSQIEGEYLYNNSYFKESLKAYTSVNFYENKNIIPLRTIAKIKKRALANGKYYYNKALKNKTNKKQMLKELNRVFKNVDSYKNAQELFDELKDDNEISLFLESLENPLKIALLKKKKLATIEKLLKNITIYDDSNSIAIEAKDYIRDELRTIINSAVELYETKQYSKSLTKFKIAKTVYKKSKTLNSYIQKMTQKKKKKKSKTTKIERKKIVKKLIIQGRKHYEKQDFENAKKTFSKVLKYESNNNTSKIYLQKIELQLKTLEQLK